MNQAFGTAVNIGGEKGESCVYLLDTHAVRETNPCMRYRSRLYIMIKLQNTAYTPMTRPIQCFSPQTIVQKSR